MDIHLEAHLDIQVGTPADLLETLLDPLDIQVDLLDTLVDHIVGLLDTLVDHIVGLLDILEDPVDLVDLVDQVDQVDQVELRVDLLQAHLQIMLERPLLLLLYPQLPGLPQPHQLQKHLQHPLLKLLHLHLPHQSLKDPLRTHNIDLQVVLRRVQPQHAHQRHP